jgi:hypothetical protein
LNAEEINACLFFGKEMYDLRAQSVRDFGKKDLLRTQKDFILDTAQGKLAEVAFAHFVYTNYDLTIPIDLNVYPEPDVTDYGGDIGRLRFNDLDFLSRSRIDIKAVKPQSKWLLIPRERFSPGAYVLVALDIPYGAERADHGFTIGKHINAEVFGFAYHYDFLDVITNRPKRLFKQGEFLGHNVVLRGNDALGLLRRDLRFEPHEWDSLIQWFVQSCAPAA